MVDGMDEAFNKHGEGEEYFLQLEGKPGEKTSLARHRGRCDDVIKPTVWLYWRYWSGSVTVGTLRPHDTLESPTVMTWPSDSEKPQRSVVSS
jgi:hypothetical protein